MSTTWINIIPKILYNLGSNPFLLCLGYGPLCYGHLGYNVFGFVFIWDILTLGYAPFTYLIIRSENVSISTGWILEF